ncbi:rhoptry-associated protein 2/3, putative [Plasmodium chabaudi chabaudi]|uniref:Rhoptry-associated protein 2/3, putative n=1 Tax=Plasmodium chabaudi chabaudi TaxID=31271 RepID=A0A1C6YIQ2_PLACU|nr:rhoptry-associated protein 2/3, putative [Plasmodium chabaudi chabaudi]SCN60788.1 rhoptry-associated protein 2/3, putative [Plasmodium chabaudi chabaudi]
MNTKHIIYLLFSFFFCHVAYGDKCAEPLTSLNFENFTLFHMLKVHDDKDEKLATWIHFFFNQFRGTEHAVGYMHQLNINIINQEDQACFIRAFNIYLIHKLSYHTKCVINNGEKNYYEKKYDIIKQYCTDFIEVVNTPSLHKYFDTVITRKIGVEEIEEDLGIIKGMIKKATLEDPAKFTADPMKALTAIKMVENVDDPSIDPVKLAIRDYQLLAILSLKNHYYNSNITSPILDVRRDIDSKVRLWFRKRSKLFPLYLDSSMLFGSFQCHVNGKTYYETPDYFVHGFFSAIKEKMTKIYIRFLSNFNNAVEKKSYKIESLKGIRYLKSLFLRKTFPNFVRLHVDYMETELSFLRETFLDMYDNTINCYATKYANKAGANFIDSKMIPD